MALSARETVRNLGDIRSGWLVALACAIYGGACGDGDELRGSGDRECRICGHGGESPAARSPGCPPSGGAAGPEHGISTDLCLAAGGLGEVGCGFVCNDDPRSDADGGDSTGSAGKGGLHSGVGCSASGEDAGGGGSVAAVGGRCPLGEGSASALGEDDGAGAHVDAAGAGGLQAGSSPSTSAGQAGVIASALPSAQAGAAAESEGSRSCGVATDLAPDSAEPPSPVGCNPGEIGSDCAGDPTGFSCTLREIWLRCADFEVLSDVMARSVESEAELALALFPEAAQRTWRVALPSINGPLASVEISPFASCEISSPIDWLSNPEHNNTWRFWFQTLNWIHDIEGAEPDVLNRAGTVIVDWTCRILMAEPRFEWTWSDHGLAARAQTANALAERWLNSGEALSLPVMAAVAKLLLTHLYALAAEPCYTPRHNHGVMQDMAVMKLAQRFSHLPDAEALWDHAARRFMELQLADAVSSDGVHREHSPHYHVLFSSWLPRISNLYKASGRSIPSEIHSALGGMLEVLVHLMQPNHTMPQFGDTPNDDRSAELARLVNQCRTLEGSEALGLEDTLLQLDYVLSNGETGMQPQDVDRVYLDGGYATLRSSWEPPVDSALVAHLRSGQHSSAHYHTDDTTFELFGFNHEIILDGGLHSYDSADPFRIYQKSPEAHNVLTIEGVAAAPAGSSSIDAHGTSEDISWVHLSNDHYSHAGFSRIRRTFAYNRPAEFLVVDSLSGGGTHQLVERLHLHPSFDTVLPVGNAVSISGSLPGLPSLLVVPLLESAATTTARGIDGDELRGWWFPSFNRAEPATEVMISTTLHMETAVDVGYLILVSAPDEPTEAISGLEFSRTGSEYVVSWESDASGARTLVIPTPD